MALRSGWHILVLLPALTPVTILASPGIFTTAFADFNTGGVQQVICSLTNASCAGTVAVPGTAMAMTYHAHGAGGYGQFRAYGSASISGPPGGTPPDYAVVRGRSAWQDVITISGGTAGTAGSLILQFSATGTTTVSTPTNCVGDTDNCADAGFNVRLFASDGSHKDYTFEADSNGLTSSPPIPFVFGQPFEYAIWFTAGINIWNFSNGSSATSDYYEAATLTKIQVLNANQQTVPDFRVQAESGAQYNANGIAPAVPDLVSPANGAIGASFAPTVIWNPADGATSYGVYFGTSPSPPLVANTTATSYAPGTLSPGATYYWQIVARNAAGSASSPTWSFTTGVPAIGSRFVPVNPCRVADTRNPLGPFGGPAMTAGSTRSFPIPQSGCNIPPTAQAYAVNVTVVPNGPLSYLTLWPTGQPQPFVSTLNSFGGIVVANAAIVPAGSGGAVSVFVSNQTDVILDITGYFDPFAGPGGYVFYAATPCRVADTRGATGQFGGPSMFGGQTRDFPLILGSCGIPAYASAFSLNVTALPATSFLAYLTTWPTGPSIPLVSTLNSWTGKVVANAALVPGGANGSVSVFVTDPADVILDINGYFGIAGGAGALAFSPVTPCRVADTRNPAGPFGGPEMEAGSRRSFAIPAGGCNVPSTAAAYSVNVTAVPDGPLSYLTAWPTGSAQPFVSTLNSFDGAVVANAAIVPAGANGAMSIFVTDRTHVILDINGYFAP